MKAAAPRPSLEALTTDSISTLFSKIQIQTCSLRSIFCVCLVGPGLLLSLVITCCFFTSSPGLPPICIALGYRKHRVSYRLWSQAAPSPCAPRAPPREGLVALFSLAGQSLLLLLYCVFLKRPLGIYNTIKSIFLGCNFPSPAYFVS